MKPAAAVASEAQTFDLLGDAVFPGSLADDEQSHVFAAPTPVVFETAVVFDSPLAVLGGCTDAAFVDLAAEPVQHVVCCAVVALEALAGALDGIRDQRIDAALAAGIQTRGKAATI